MGSDSISDLSYLKFLKSYFQLPRIVAVGYDIITNPKPSEMKQFIMIIFLLAGVIFRGMTQGNFSDPKFGIGEFVFNPTVQFEVRAKDSVDKRTRIARFTLSNQFRQLHTSEMVEIRNSSDENGTMAPTIHGHKDSTGGTGFLIIGSTSDDQDTMTSPITHFKGMTYSNIDYLSTEGPSGPGAIETRPLFQWSNNYSTQMTLSPDGDLGIGTVNIKNKVDVEGDCAIGTYAGVDEAEPDGMLVEGDFGIGVSSPLARVHAASDANNTNPVGDKDEDVHFDFETTKGSGSNDGEVFRIYSERDSSEIDIFRVGNNGGGGTENVVFTIRGDGKMGVGKVNNSYKFTITGNGLASGGTWTPSDTRLKENVREIEGPMEKVMDLSGVTYNYNENPLLPESLVGQQSAGVLAQEVEEVLPELIRESDGLKAVNYDGLIGLLIASSNQLSDRIQDARGHHFANTLLLKSRGPGSQEASLDPSVELNDGSIRVQYSIKKDFLEGEIGFYDLHGKEMLKRSLSNMSGEVQLDPGSVNSGQYYCVLILDGDLHTSKKIVISY